MNKNQKGLSTIVTTLIIVLLVLVAIAIVWGVVLPLFQGGEEEITQGGNALIQGCAAVGEECTLSEDCIGGTMTAAKDTSRCCAQPGYCLGDCLYEGGNETCATGETCAESDVIASTDTGTCCAVECTPAAP